MTEIKLNQCNNSQQQQHQVHQPECGTSSRQQNNINNNNRPQYKKTQSFIYPVLNKFVNKNRKPKPKERATLILLGIMLILFIISVTGFFIMWLTEFYNNYFISQLVLSNNSEAADLWLNSPIQPHLKVHIFNYTNIDKYLKGIDDKIIVQDLGPYTYEEHSKKVNVSFNTNYTVTYRDHRWYKFLDELSVGLQNDSIIIPNVPLMSAAEKIQNMNSYLKRTVAEMAIKRMSLKPFEKLTAKDIIWGHKDAIMQLTNANNGRFGMLMKRNGTSVDSYQIHTGEDDLENVGIISQFNGMTNLKLWSTDECNRIDGTDGSQFPPHLMNKDTNLYVFLSSMCRKLPLEYEKEVTLFDDVTAWRYRTPLNVFSTPDINPANKCYCNKKTGDCPPSGVMDGTDCYDGAPIHPSFPHFYSGDPNIYSKFIGIKPIKELHSTYADIHPRLAFPIKGASRLQINIKFRRRELVKDVTGLDDGIILPILWIEVTNGELSTNVRKFIYHTTVIVNLMQFALKYGTLLTCVTSFALLVAAVYYLSKSEDDDNNDDYDEKNEPELESLNKTVMIKV